MARPGQAIIYAYLLGFLFTCKQAGALSTCVDSLDRIVDFAVDGGPIFLDDGTEILAGEYLTLLVDSSSRVYGSLEDDITAVNPGNIGNFDECNRIPDAQLCLAGSIDLANPFVAPAPFAGLCLPSACSEADLQDPKLADHISSNIMLGRLLPHLSLLTSRMAEEGQKYLQNSTASSRAAYAHNAGEALGYASGAVEFFRNLEDTMSVAVSRGQGFTCGSWKFNFWSEYVAIGVTVAMGLLTVVVVRATWADLKKERSVSGRWRERLSIIPSREPSVSRRLDDYAGGAAAGAAAQALREEGYGSAGSAGSAAELDRGHSRSASGGGGGAGRPGNGTIPESPASRAYDLRQGPAANAGERQLVLSFSAARTLTRLFTVKDRNPGLGIFDGLRVLSMLWIVLGHSLAIQGSVGYTNPWALLPPSGMLGSWMGQVFFSARFAVDTFFFMSGFLVVFVMLRRFETKAMETGVRKTSPNLVSWLPFFYIHRYLRIVPLYAVILLIWWKLGVFLGDGPFWFRWLGYTKLCDKLWWTNLLFVNNVVPQGVCETCGCLYVSWYLGNDMQFYLLSPLFFVVYYYRNLTGMTLTLLVAGGLTLLTARDAAAHDWSDLTFDGKWVTTFSHHGYTVPWVKAPPYLVGMWTGMFWHRREKRWPDWKFSRAHARVAVGLSQAVLFFLIFCGLSAYQQPPCGLDQAPVAANHCGSAWPEWAIVAHTALARPLWAWGLSLLSITCFLGQGGLLQSVLAHPAWVPLSRLTFAVYLIHPLILNVWFFRQTEKYRYSDFDFAMTYLCVVFVAFALAVFATVLVEQPIAGLVKGFEEWLQPLMKRRAGHKALGDEEGGGGEEGRGGRLTFEMAGVGGGGGAGKKGGEVRGAVRRTEKTSLLEDTKHTNV